MRRGYITPETRRRHGLERQAADRNAAIVKAAGVGVFRWREGDTYTAAEAVKVYKSDTAAQRYADRLTYEARAYGSPAEYVTRKMFHLDAPRYRFNPERGSSLAAFEENERADPMTGEPGILRKEWRVRRLRTPKEFDDARAIFYGATGAFILEMRYIRRGVIEPWEMQEHAATAGGAIAYIPHNSNTVAVSAALRARWARDAGHARRRRGREAARASAAGPSVRQGYARASEGRAAFSRMKAGKVIQNQIAADVWAQMIVTLNTDRAFLLAAVKDPRFRTLYDAAEFEARIPQKRAAIKAFLIRLPGYYRRLTGRQAPAAAAEWKRIAVAGFKAPARNPAAPADAEQVFKDAAAIAWEDGTDSGERIAGEIAELAAAGSGGRAGAWEAAAEVADEDGTDAGERIAAAIRDCARVERKNPVRRRNPGREDRWLLIQAGRATLDALQRERARSGVRLKLPAAAFGHSTAEGLLSHALGAYAGARRNPVKRTRNNPFGLRPRGTKQIYGRVQAIIARKTARGPEYIHEFSTPVRAIGLPDGRAILEAS